jgi:hypothetical protein
MAKAASAHTAEELARLAHGYGRARWARRFPGPRGHLPRPQSEAGMARTAWAGRALLATPCRSPGHASPGGASRTPSAALFVRRHLCGITAPGGTAVTRCSLGTARSPEMTVPAVEQGQGDRRGPSAFSGHLCRKSGRRRPLRRSRAPVMGQKTGYGLQANILTAQVAQVQRGTEPTRQCVGCSEGLSPLPVAGGTGEVLLLPAVELRVLPRPPDRAPPLAHAANALDGLAPYAELALGLVDGGSPAGLELAVAHAGRSAHPGHAFSRTSGAWATRGHRHARTQR